MRTSILFVTIFVGLAFLTAKEFFITGKQESVIQYRLVQQIVPFPGIDQMQVSFVVPTDFQSPTYQQQINELEFRFNPEPVQQSRETDQRGNQVRKFLWENPTGTIQCEVALKAHNRVKLEALQSSAPFPLTEVPAEVRPYLQPTEQVPSQNEEIRTLARKLTTPAGSELEAVRAVLHYVNDHLHYVLVPKQYDALYSLHTGKGNCQNYSHLSAALLRAVGIPARIVNGITLKKSYDLDVGEAIYTFDMAQGRHSWIEVYFPDVGWLPFDPQQTEFFVSNRYLRIEVGLDNQETIQDGLVRWSQSSGSEKQVPQLEEAIEANFVQDQVQLKCEKIVEGPASLFLSPMLEPAMIAATPPPPEEPKPGMPEPGKPEPGQLPEDLANLTYRYPLTIGNLDFPRNFDFLRSRLFQQQSGENGELKRNFIVETAEYVTGKEQFAQVFVLEEPMILRSISLALHSFGGSGELWLELCEDEGGKPGAPAARSRRISMREIPNLPGYDWINFDFTREGLLLTPGRYWFVLKFSGSPIVNWFFSYGKPVGPVDGTRSCPIGQNNWQRILNYEFNYKVTGRGAVELHR